MPNPALLALASFLFTQPSAAAAQNCKTVEGTFAAHLVTDKCHSLRCTAGTLTGGLAGTYVFHETKEDEVGDKAPKISFFVGESTVTLDDGRTLAGVDTGTFDTTPDRGGFASLISWNTGGQIRVRGVMVVSKDMPPETKGDYQGTVCDARKM